MYPVQLKCQVPIPSFVLLEMLHIIFLYIYISFLCMGLKNASTGAFKHRISFKRTIRVFPVSPPKIPQPPETPINVLGGREVPLNAPSLSFETAYGREKMWPFSWVAPRCSWSRYVGRGIGKNWWFPGEENGKWVNTGDNTLSKSRVMYDFFIIGIIIK